MNTLEWIGVGIGLVYLYLEYHASIWLWAASIVMPAIYIFVYYDAGIYADMGINIFYLISSFYGWILWYRGKGTDVKKEELPITHTPLKRIFPYTLIGLFFFIVISYILINFTNSTIPYGDSFTTAASIVGLLMLARKYVEQWLVWLVVDAVCTILYIYKGLYPTAGLYALYSVISVAGYFKWLKLMRNDKIQVTK